MNTKRCTYCHKLSRAEAEICSRCGLPLPKAGSSRTKNMKSAPLPVPQAGSHALPLFPEQEVGASASTYGQAARKERTRISSPSKDGSRSLLSASGYRRSVRRSSNLPSSPGNPRVQKRSIPPASPHRAGHYSGLHPEDQPYQSTVMAAQRPPARQPKAQEPAQRDQSTVMAVQRPPAQSKPHEPQSILLPVLDSRPEPEPDYEKTLEKTLAPRFVFPSASLPKRAWPRGRFVTTMLTLSCLILLVAGSLVAYAFINNKSVPGRQILTIQPNLVRVNDFFTLSGKGFGINDLISFTHDKGQPLLNGNGRPLQTHADDLGTFSVQVMAPSTWEVGQHSIYAIDIGKEQSISVLATLTIEGLSLAPPLLQLSSSSLDLGTSVPGVVSKKMITLINAGGKYLTWQASSDQPWLIASPSSGTFSGEATVDVMANSGSLPPQFYKGHITFRQLR